MNARLTSTNLWTACATHRTTKCVDEAQRFLDADTYGKCKGPTGVERSAFTCLLVSFCCAWACVWRKLRRLWDPATA